MDTVQLGKQATRRDSMCAVGTGLGTFRCRRAPHGRDAPAPPGVVAFPSVAFALPPLIADACADG